MKEISIRLEKQDAVICVSCGAIFAKGTLGDCPECGQACGLRWITPAHTWRNSLQLKGEKV